MKHCGCGARLGKNNQSGLCRSCAARLRYRDPAARAAMSAAKRAALKDPAKRSRVVSAATVTLEKVRDRPKRKRGYYLNRVPRERRPEYLRLRAMLGADEAYRIICEDERMQVRRRMRVAQTPQMGT